MATWQPNYFIWNFLKQFEAEGIQFGTKCLAAVQTPNEYFHVFRLWLVWKRSEKKSYQREEKFPCYLHSYEILVIQAKKVCESSSSQSLVFFLLSFQQLFNRSVESSDRKKTHFLIQEGNQQMAQCVRFLQLHLSVSPIQMNAIADERQSSYHSDAIILS